MGTQGWRLDAQQARERRERAAEGGGGADEARKAAGTERRSREGSREESLFQVLVEGDEPIGVSVQKCLRTSVAKVSR
jgi:hypothetical protein